MCRKASPLLERAYCLVVPGEEIRIDPAGPAKLLAAVLPLTAVVLVAVGALRGGMEQSADEPVAPWVVAVITVGGALILAWRALTQMVLLGDDHVVIRNMSSTARLHWSTVEELRFVSRPGLRTVEVLLRGTRRRHRMGAASRWSGHGADEVADQLAAHPVAGELFTVERS